MQAPSNLRNLFTSVSLAAATATVVGSIATAPVQAQTTEACSNDLGCTLLLDDRGLVVGIEDLSIMDIVFDVEWFEEALFFDIFDPTGADSTKMVPTFWQDESGALDAGQQIALALGSTFQTPDLQFFPSPPFFGDNFVIPFDLSGSVLNIVNDNFNNVLASDLVVSTLAFSVERNTQPFVKFTKQDDSGTEVPEPASMLALLALGGVGLATAKKKHC